MGEVKTDEKESVLEGEIVPEKSLTEWTPKFVVTVDQAVARHDERLDYLKRVLREGTHYGVIPGTGSKPALLKPGAESLMADMGLRPDMLDELPPMLDFDGREHNGEPFIHYQRKANLYRLHPQTGDRVWVGSGSGSCNSWEDKYRWRTQVRTCPTCKVAAIIKGKAEWGGGWVCFKKKGGCGAKFADGDKAIEGQPLGRVANDRVADLANTILKMADKRAIVAAVLNTTGVSDLFTQDVDEQVEMDPEERARYEASREVAPANAPKPAATPAPARKSTAAAKPPEQKAQAPAPAPTTTPWTEPMKELVRARVKFLQTERSPVIYGAFKDFMNNKVPGDAKWTSLYEHAELFAECYTILGIPDAAADVAQRPVAGPAFDPSEVPA